MLVLVVGWLTVWNAGPDISTRVGEQRTITLSDGSRVALNTDTRIVVGRWNGTREIRLVRGEAYFEVAKNLDQPFVVIAGEKKVVAIGTTFDVRLRSNSRGEEVSVTLVEGKVAVTNLDVAPQTVFNANVPVPILTAGQRMVVAEAEQGAGKIDLPKLDTVTSWRRGEIVLDNTRLADAIIELNRYSAISLTIDDPATANLAISGIFRTGDTDAFANAVATFYGLTVVRQSQKLVIAGKAVPR
jgi:transmembrane sensor